MKFNEYCLGEVVEIYNSKRIPLSTLQRNQQIDKRYPYYGAQGIIDYVEDYIFDGKYLLIAEDGENLRSRNEDIAIIAEGKFWVNNHAHILKNNSKSNMEVLKFIINNIDLSGNLTGSAQPKLNKQNLEAISIKLPDIECQNKIGGIIELFEEKIRTNNAIIMNLEKISQCIFKNWFFDYEFPNEQGLPYRLNGGEMSENIEGTIPKGWRISTIYELIKERKEKNKEELDIPVLSVVKEGKFLQSSDFFNKRVYSKKLTNYKIINKFDVGFNPSRANIGSIALLREFEKGLLSPVYKVFSLENDLTPEYFYQIMQTDYFKQFIKTNSVGTTRQNFDIDSFKNYYIVLPPKHIQNKYANLVSNFRDKIELIQQQNGVLETLKNTLIPKLLSGELNILNEGGKCYV